MTTELRAPVSGKNTPPRHLPASGGQAPAPGGEVRIVKRADIPRIVSVEQDGHVHQVGELRDFRWSDALRRFMPSESVFSVSWVGLAEGEMLQVHTHPTQSMMIVYAGQGDLMGDLCRVVKEGDTIVVPPGRRHGFVGGKGGMYALSIQFGEGLYTKPEDPRVIFVDHKNSLSALLEYNEGRTALFGKHRVFDLFHDGTLEDPARQAFLGRVLRGIVLGGRKLLSSATATSGETTYESAFTGCLRHLFASSLYDVDASRRGERFWDPILEATTDWFAYQMCVLDDAEKLAMAFLVLRNVDATYRWHALGGHAGGRPSEVSGLGPASVGVELLRNETAQTYARLRRLVRESWDMVDAAADRIVQLARTSE